MDQLARIAGSGTPDTGILFRRNAYGERGVHNFLKDVLALANADVEGSRYIVVGIDFDEKGQKQAHAVDSADFAGKPSYQSLANEYIEPAIRLHYKPVSMNGARVGVFEIGDCQDRPYMMRIDYSEALRRGDASLPTCDLTEMPSALASRKLEEMLRLTREAGTTGTPTIVSRLTHARLYGAQEPFVDRTPEQILAELEEVRSRYRDQDNRFLFNERPQRVQLIALNQGNEAIVGASLSLVLPNHKAFYIADAPPKRFLQDRFIDSTPEDIARYPTVTLQDDCVKIMANIGDIPPGEPSEVFQSPLLVCVGPELKGRRFGIRYRLDGQNLRRPATGRLKLEFS
jgi:hypothetical protein